MIWLPVDCRLEIAHTASHPTYFFSNGQKTRMEFVDLLQQSRLVVDFGLLVLIWLVQLIIYPSFLYTAESEFKGWHYRYTGLITLFVAPLMFGQIGIYAGLLFLAMTWDIWAGVFLTGVAWLATLILSVPCHDQMQKAGYDRTVILRLVRTNWIRTAAWTAVFALTLIVNFG